MSSLALLRRLLPLTLLLAALGCPPPVPPPDGSTPDGSTPDDDGGMDADANPEPTVSTTVIAYVTDESGAPVGAATVSAHGVSAQTDGRGMAVLRGVAAPTERLAVLARKSGYYTGARAQAPVANGASVVRIALMASTTTAMVAASAGGNVTANGAVVELPAGGFTRQGGASYGGQVAVAARWLDPTAAGFARFFPDATGRRASGAASSMVSYGVMRVELRDTAAAPLALASGASAGLRFPIPAAQLATAPATMPLWYFDEAAGRWQEQGEARREGNFYVGRVGHFTDWNADVPEEAAFVTGRVTCADEPYPGATVTVGQNTTASGAEGAFRVRVPANTPMEAQAVAPETGGTSQTAQVPPIAPGATHNVGDLAITDCPAIITGTTTCDGARLTALVGAGWGTGYTMVFSDGHFSVRVPAGRAVTISAEEISVTGPREIFIGANVDPLRPGERRDVGILDLCWLRRAVDEFPLVPPFPLTPEFMQLNTDGSQVLFGANNVGLVFANAQTHSVLRTIPVAMAVRSMQALPDFSRVLFWPWHGGPEVWNGATAQRLRVFPEIESFPVLTPDGATVIGRANTDWSIASYSVATGARVRRYSFGGSDGRLAAELIGTTAGGTQLILSYVESLTLEAPARVTLWDLVNDREVVTHTLPWRFVESELRSTSPDGSVLVFFVHPGGGGDDRFTVFVDTRTGRELLRIPYERVRVFADNARYLAGGSDESTGRVTLGVYDLRDGAAIARWMLPGNYPEILAVSGDGRSHAVTYWTGSESRLRRWPAR